MRTESGLKFIMMPMFLWIYPRLALKRRQTINSCWCKVTKHRAQGYVVIIDDPIKFKTDWPNFVGTIFDSSFSLSNSGETLAIKMEIKLSTNIRISQLGGAGDGKSLQKIMECG